MNVEIGAEAALFPEKKYISGIFVAVQSQIMIILISYAGLLPSPLPSAFKHYYMLLIQYSELGL